jgi:hypothetical protein
MTTIAVKPSTVLALPVPPQLSVTVSVTRYTPAAVNVWEALTEPGVGLVGSVTVPASTAVSNIHCAVCVPPPTSVNVLEKLTAVPTANTAPLTGPVIVTTGSGFVTVTVKLQLLTLPARSFAVAVTVLVPIGKAEPDGGVLTSDAIEQLSVAVTV